MIETPRLSAREDERALERSLASPRQFLSVRDLCKVYTTRFGENRVLEGVNFELARGERLGILGRNGAGKSTLIRIVSGAEKPTAGTVESNMSISWPLAFGGAFHGQLTGIDNVRFISRLYGQDEEENIAFVRAFAELGPYLREEVRTYSSGMRARLAFAISMIIEFDCFLIDEIASVGDVRFHERCNRELFEKRGDRAMIIVSHDAGYLRDHCNRFAVLDEGRLALFDDFDEAYGDFRRKIGAQQVGAADFEGAMDDRNALIAYSHLVALRDERFRALVQEADWLRDARDWQAAERAYAKALELYPYQRSYWVQKAHCAKEAEVFDRAEIGYRTAIALGEPLCDVAEHLRFVMQRQGVDEAQYPAHVYRRGAASDQPPGKPDAAIFARACWGVDALDPEEELQLLRKHATCDGLLGAMVEDARFADFQARWIARAGHTRPDERLEDGAALFDPSASDEQGGDAEIAGWESWLVTIGCPHIAPERRRAIHAAIAKGGNAWAAVMAAGGFAGWNRLHAALARLGAGLSGSAGREG